MKDSKTLTKKKGRLLSFNVSPKGGYEGFLIKTAKGSLQMNFPPDRAEEMAAFVAEGNEITAYGREEEKRDGAAHPVFELDSVERADGRKLEMPGKHSGGNDAFEGRVKRLNYARHGEPNGGILDSGDFVHLKPHGARAVKLKIGLALKGKGVARPMLAGGQVIEAELANGIAMKAKAKKKHGPKHAH